MSNTVVAVLRGGIGGEHEVSLSSGATVIQELSKEQHDISVIDIFIDRSGTWYVRGVPKVPERALVGVDVVWNALHGQYGEDGTVQRILDRIGVPYTGSTAYASALAMNKVLTKREVERLGIRTPRSTILSVTANLDSDVLNCFRSFPQPSVVKPLNSGSSVGVTIARSFNQLQDGVREVFQHASQVLVEELIVGKEATCGVVDNFRNEVHYTLPPVEIIPPDASAFFDYDAKYSGLTSERCPGNFSSKETEDLKECARAAHHALGMRHYSRSDFIVSPRGIYFLEINSLPGTTGESLLPKSLQAVGVSMNEFVQHVLNLARNRG